VKGTEKGNRLAKTLIQFAGQENVIIVYRAFVDFTGNIEAAMMLSQLLYWTPRSTMNGWIAKSDREFQEELCLSRYGIRTAKMKLEEMKLIKVRKLQFNGAPTLHYMIDMDELENQWKVRFQTIDYLKTYNP